MTETLARWTAVVAVLVVWIVLGGWKGLVIGAVLAAIMLAVGRAWEYRSRGER